MSVGEVTLTLVLMDNCITHMTLDGPQNESVTDKIRQYRADYDNRPFNLFPLCLLFLVLPDDYTVNLCAFYFCGLIGKLTGYTDLAQSDMRALCDLVGTLNV